MPSKKRPITSFFRKSAPPPPVPPPPPAPPVEPKKSRVPKTPTEQALEALKSNEWYHRERAALALGNLREVKAVGPLVGLLGDPESPVRGAVREALAKIGKPAVNALKRALKSPDHTAQDNAQAVLNEILRPKPRAPRPRGKR